MCGVVDGDIVVFFDKRCSFCEVVKWEGWCDFGMFEKVGVVVYFMELYDKVY